MPDLTLFRTASEKAEQSLLCLNIAGAYAANGKSELARQQLIKGAALVEPELPAVIKDMGEELAAVAEGDICFHEPVGRRFVSGHEAVVTLWSHVHMQALDRPDEPVPADIVGRLGVNISALRVHLCRERTKILAAKLLQPDRSPGEPPDPAGNSMRLTGEIWHIHYEDGDEAGNFNERKSLRYLAQILTEPNRRFSAIEILSPPAGTGSLPFLGRDESSDDQAMKDEQNDLRRLVQEIKEADNARDTELAEKLRTEFNALFEHVEGERRSKKRGHAKRCGTPSPGEKAHNALRVALERLKTSLRKKGLPKLTDHLEKYIVNDNGKWLYAPPPDTSPWQITIPLPSEN